MSNCSNLFIKFNGELNITSSKKKKLKASRDELRASIRKYFKENYPDYKPKFRDQGSSPLGTMIRTKDDTCDLDNGVYFFPKPKETPTTVQGWVWNAVENATTEKPQHRQKCIRVIYKGDYHIDLPVYYKESETNDAENPHLAVKDNGWQKSDPKEFREWFEKRKDEEGQLVRIVRFLKAWCDNRAKKMPNGLTMTVLAANNIQYDERDDKALRSTLKQIKTALKFSWRCVMPTTPKDDLLENYTGDKGYFFEALDALIADADVAIDTEKNQLAASKLWRKHLGSYFPEGEDADVDKREQGLRQMAATILSQKAKTDAAGIIQETTGVKHQPHKNYGG
ncbi:MAG: CBASS cGAMP synthase [Bacteroidia bacterium]